VGAAGRTHARILRSGRGTTQTRFDPRGRREGSKQGAGRGRIDRGRKLRIYAEAGVAWLWLVDPREQTLEVLRLGEGAWTIAAVHTGRDEVRAEPFDAIELGLGELWPEADPA
jgi:hypothetical protein